MAINTETGGTPFIEIKVTAENYPLIKRQLFIKESGDQEVDALVRALGGKFVQIQGKLGLTEGRLIAQITDLFIHYHVTDPESNEVKITYDIVFDGFGAVDPDRSPKTMVPLDARTKLGKKGITFSYNTLEELKADWIDEAKPSIFKLTINGEAVFAPNLTRRQVLMAYVADYLAFTFTTPREE